MTAPVLLLLLALAGVACSGGRSSAAAPSAQGSPTASTPAPSAALSTPELVQRLRPSVVRIQSEAATLDVFGQPVPSRGVGTGLIIDDQGHVVTNNHVVVRPGTCDQPAQRITVTLADGRNFTAQIVGRDVATDLAVLKIPVDHLALAPLGDSQALPVGADVVAIGNALDLPGGATVTKGVLSAQGRLIEENQCGVTIPGAIQTDAAINPGNSGGPLVDMQGQVIGITTAVIRGEAQGVGFAISSDTAKPIIDELIKKGRVERGFLGVSIAQITPSLAETLGLPVDHGVGVRQAEAGGPADQAGLKPGDIIVKVAGQEVNTTGDLFQILAHHKAGEKVKVEYYRDGSLHSKEVTLGQRPESA